MQQEKKILQYLRSADPEIAQIGRELAKELNIKYYTIFVPGVFSEHGCIERGMMNMSNGINHVDEDDLPLIYLDREEAQIMFVKLDNRYGGVKLKKW